MMQRLFRRKVIIQKCTVELGTYFKLMKKDGKASCSIWIEGNTPVLCDLYVSKSHRKRGIATKMIRLCEEIVKEEGFEHIFLWTREGSWLVMWYRQKGYEPTGEILLRPGESFRNIWLRKEL